MAVGPATPPDSTPGASRSWCSWWTRRWTASPASSAIGLSTADAELAKVRRRLDRLYNLVETTDLDIEDFKPRIRDHRERQEKLEASAAEARAMLSDRRGVLDDVETITAYAQDMSVFLNESELTERRAFIQSFVKEIVVMPGNALLRYTIPMPDDSPIPGRNAEEMVLNGSVLSTVKIGGAGGNRISTWQAWKMATAKP